MSDIVRDMEKYRRGWTGGLPETPCGFGSTISQTRIQRAWLPRMVEKYDIRSISDIGAGDMNWIELINWPHSVEYKPFDLVPRRPEVVEFDIVQEVPERADCLMCLWVLNHLPEDHARTAMGHFRASGSEYLIYTYEPRQWACTNIEAMESVVIRDRGAKDKRGNVELRLARL